MILKHTRIVEAISRVGLPEFQSKDRLTSLLTSLQPTRQSGAYAALSFSLISVNSRRRRKQSKGSDFSPYFPPKAEALSLCFIEEDEVGENQNTKPNRKSKEGWAVYVT
jgi:hypothetical protein